MTFKVDMAKAYDKLEWRFLLKAMEKFGFSPQAIDLVYRNICNIWYNFRINGEYYGSFRSTRGVPQGDPLSPLLFVLAQQILSAKLKQLTAQNVIKRYQVGRNEQIITHVFYADDVLIFTNGSKRSLMNLMKLLRDYQASSDKKSIPKRAPFMLEVRPRTEFLLSLVLQG